MSGRPGVRVLLAGHGNPLTWGCRVPKTVKELVSQVTAPR